MPLPGHTASSDVPHKGPPGVLTPSSDGSLNRIQHSANDGKPQPRMNSNALESLLKSTFVVKVCEDDLSPSQSLTVASRIRLIPCRNHEHCSH